MKRRKQFITSNEATTAKKQHTAPCSDCPWARTSVPGWLGPATIKEWVACAHSDSPVDCHTRVKPDGEHWQCAGMAIYRANVVKWVDPPLLRLPVNKTLVFSWGEFEKHHDIGRE